MSQWPKTVEEAVDQLLSSMSDEDKQTVKNTPESELIQYHFGWGTGIRNEFGLWRGNEELLVSCGSADMQPDDASMVIIKAGWKRLQEK